MTGAQLSLTIEDHDITAALGRLNMLSGPTRIGLMRAIGVGLVETTQSRFDTATDPDGSAWKSLLPAYAAVKRGPGILREAGMRGGLQGSITFAVTSASTVEVGTNKVYGAVHQFGAKIVPKNGKALVFRIGNRLVRAASVTIPARPYLGFGAADREMVQDVVEFTVAKLLRGK